MYVQIKVCPSCGDEFQPRVEQCPDCGTALEMKETGGIAGGGGLPGSRPTAGAGPGDGPVPSGYALGSGDLPREGSAEAEDVVPLGISGEPGDVRQVSVLLSRERIRHWLLSSATKDPLAAYNKPTDYLEIFVHSDDLDRAAALVREHLWEDLPEGLEVTGDELGEGSPRDDACPACSTPLPPGGADECPECGLVVGGG